MESILQVHEFNNFKIPIQPGFGLVEAVRQEIRQIDKSEQSIKNILATFNQLLKRGIIHENSLKNRFDSGFEQLRCEIKTHVQETAKNRQWLSHINDIRNAVDRVYAFDLSEMSFNEALLHLCKRKWGYTLSKHKLLCSLSHETNISLDTIYSWDRRNSIPNTSRGIARVTQLDEFFHTNGALRGKVNIACNAKYITEPYEKYPNFPLPDTLKKQLNDYIKFRVDGTPPNRKVLFGNEMDERQLRSLRNLKGKETWTKDCAGECYTKTYFLSRVQAYCNFIAKESKSLEKEVDWDIQLLMDHEWLYRFKEDSKTRGVFATSMDFFQNIHHECAPNSYFSTFHAFTKNKESWLREINLLKEECSAYSRELNKFRKSDKGKENIAFLLSSENLEELIAAIANELDRRQTYFNGSLKMSSALTAICFRALIELPLRVKNMCQLKYLEDFNPDDEPFINWPSLFFDTRLKTYRVIIPKEFLKNRNSKGISDINYCYSTFLTPFIRRYLTLRENFFLKHRIKSPYFLFTVSPSRNRSGEQTTVKNLGSLFSRATYKALVTLWGNFVKKHNLRGINIHAMRHLSATLFLKHHPENYSALATLLMDDLNTVISIYAKRDDQGNFEKIRNFSETIWNNQLKGGDHE